MIILIGGIGCSGKTLLANQLMRKTQISYFSLDHLMMGIYRGIPNCGFTPMDDKFVIGEKLWPVIKALIMTNIENNHSIILEGIQLLPHLIFNIPSDYHENVVPVFLFFSGQYIQKNLEDKIIKNRNVIENRSDIDDLSYDKLISETRRLKESCINNEIAFIEIADDFIEEMKKAEDYVLSRYKSHMRKR
jgi:putative acetyltransferase